jgi:hypothetical protein
VINKGRERNSIDLRRFCETSLHHGILRKTERVRVDLNSENREGSVAIGLEAIRGRLREIENILVLVQIKDENWTNSKHFSYMNTNIDPPIIAHWFPSLGGDSDNPIHLRVGNPSFRRQPRDENWFHNDNDGSEKDLLYNPIYDLLNVDVRRPREEGKKKNIWTSALNRFGHKLLKYSEKRPRDGEKDTASALNCSRRGAVRVRRRRKRRRRRSIMSDSKVDKSDDDDGTSFRRGNRGDKRSGSGGGYETTTTQESLSSRTASTECEQKKRATPTNVTPQATPTKGTPKRESSIASSTLNFTMKQKRVGTVTPPNKAPP